MANYKEDANRARDEFLTNLKHKIVLDLAGAGLSDVEITKVTGLSKQLISYIKKSKVESLSESNSK